MAVSMWKVLKVLVVDLLSKSKKAMKILAILIALILFQYQSLAQLSKEQSIDVNRNIPSSVNQFATELLEQITPYSHIHDIHTKLGVPLDNNHEDDILIIRPQYILSYNPARNVANWVSWQLDASWIGAEERYSGQFKQDTLLPDSLYRVRHQDYTNSGYDRGHILRSKERTVNDEDNISTFFMTNVMPQTPDLNRGVWLDFEYFCEKLATELNLKLIIISGGIFRTDSTLKGEGKVAVPDSCFKIAVLMEPYQDLQDINDETIVIAVIMPNINGIRRDKWQKYTATVRQIEYSTGYNFLKRVPEDIQEIIENCWWIDDYEE